jgi:hypothetical protein
MAILRQGAADLGVLIKRLGIKVSAHRWILDLSWSRSATEHNKKACPFKFVALHHKIFVLVYFLIKRLGIKVSAHRWILDLSLSRSVTKHNEEVWPLGFIALRQVMFALVYFRCIT